MKSIVLFLAIFISLPASAGVEYKCSSLPDGAETVRFKTNTTLFNRRLISVGIWSSSNRTNLPNIEFGAPQMHIKGTSTELGGGPLVFMFETGCANPLLPIVMQSGGFLTDVSIVEAPTGLIKGCLREAKILIDQKPFHCVKQ